MKNTRSRHCANWIAGIAAAAALGCTSSNGGGPNGSGGKTGSGGNTSGGNVGAGGPSSSSGGATSGNGGAPSPSGGATSSGGASSGGGASSNGGATNGSGGNGTGGFTASGGKLGAGGSSGGNSSAGASAGGASAGNAAMGGSSSPGSGGTSSGTCPSTVAKAGDSTQMIKVGTLNRSFVLHIPTGYNGTKPVPLVIDFHPLGGTGSQWEGASGWKSKADSVGFVVAYPNSYNSNNSWNVGMCCQDAQQNQIDDVAFTKGMIEQIKGIACIDPKRIYATGCSNGGGMTYKVACDMADVIAAAAPVDFRCVYGGTTSSPSCEGCKPARPISITHFDNTGDTSLVPYKGGLTSFPADCPPGGQCTGMGFPSAEDNFKTWQGLDGCTGTTSALTSNSACQTNMSCQGSAQMTMCVQQGGSHCGNYGSLKIVDTAWQLFEKQALP